MIREATHEDLPSIVQMGQSFHDASGQIAPYSEAATTQFVQGLIDSPSGVIFVSDKGMIGGALAPAYCSDNWNMAVELFWWAEDKQGLRLLRAFEKWALDQGANEIRMTTIAGLEPAERILARSGYRPAETSHTRAV